MAAACLAHKCVDLASMKVAYIKHFCACTDSQELQTAQKMVLPGLL